MFVYKKVIMEKRCLKKAIALVLILTISATFVPARAMNLQDKVVVEQCVQNNSVLNQNSEEMITSWEKKISEVVWEKIEQAEETDKISTWIWIRDINHQEIEKQVEKETGLTADNLEVVIEKILTNRMGITEEQRVEERERTKRYVRAQRTALKEAYTENNHAIIKKLDIPIEEIVFESQLTPSMIVYLTKTQIFNVAKCSDVISIDFYESESENDVGVKAFEQKNDLDGMTDATLPRSINNYVTEWDNDFKAIRGDLARNRSGLTGNGVNVLVFDNVIDPYLDYAEALIQEKIWLIKRNETEQGYEVNPLLSISDFTGYYTIGSSKHGNLVTARLQKCAKDVNVYSVERNLFEVAEKVILDLEIDIMNVSANFYPNQAEEIGYQGYYIENAHIKWFEMLAYNSKLIVIASCGNGEYNWSNCSYPGAGYNTIGVGACEINDSVIEMHDYNYNPTTGYDCVNYKPDVVMLGKSTSQAAPFVAGIVAMMVQFRPFLSAEPEAVKAILMASCHRKATKPQGSSTMISEYMRDGLTQRQGAGLVDAYRAICIIALEQYEIKSISSGSQDIYIGELGQENVNVSLVWHQNPGKIIYNETLQVDNIRELTLDVLFPNSGWERNSTKTNAGKQMVYFTSVEGEYGIRVTNPRFIEENTEIDEFKYACAWSQENINLELNLSSTLIDLSFEQGMFYYNSIKLFEKQGLYNDRNLYVFFRRYYDSSVSYGTQIYTVNMDEESIGMITDIELGAKSFNKDECLGILMYSAEDYRDETLISTQYFCPTVFDLTGW